MKTNPHKKNGKGEFFCNSNDLILVDEGVQCSRCMVLVTDKRPQKEIQMPTIEEQAVELFQFRNDLLACGFTDENTAEVIRRCGAVIPLYGGQMEGVYIRPDGRRDAHFAVHGWYSILGASKNRVLIKKLYVETADAFECGTYWLQSTVMANLEMMEGTCPTPDKTHEPTPIPSKWVALAPLMAHLLRKVSDDGGNLVWMSDLNKINNLIALLGKG